MKATKEHHETNQYCGFRIADESFAISVLKVQEVIKAYQLTRIPQAPLHIKGLINLRGQIMTAVSLRNIFGLPERENSDDHMNIVIQVGDDIYALEVDEILDVIEVSSDTYERTPENLDASFRQYISGVYKLKEDILMIVDLNKLLAEGA